GRSHGAGPRPGRRPGRQRPGHGGATAGGPGGGPAPAVPPHGAAAGPGGGDQAACPAGRAIHRLVGAGPGRFPASGGALCGEWHGRACGGATAFCALEPARLHPGHRRVRHRRRDRCLPHQWVWVVGTAAVCGRHSRFPGFVSVRAHRGRGGDCPLGLWLRLDSRPAAAPRRPDLQWPHRPVGALRQPVLPRHPPAARPGVDGGRVHRQAAGAAAVRLAWWWLRRLIRLLAFRPFPAVLLFGGVTLASHALWFATGLFIGPLPGAAITLLTGLGLAGAVFILRRGRCQMAALGVFVGFAVLVPAIALIAFRLKTGVPILMHDGAYQTEEAMRALLTNHDPYGLDYTQTSMRRWHWYVNASLHPS